MKKETVYLHVKDAKKTGEITPAGLGDGRFAEIFKELVKRGFDGFVSLEPHLSKAHASRGETAPELFKWAADSLKKVIGEAGGKIRGT
jgi:sugar phosphate isomerase/epimerase